MVTIGMNYQVIEGKQDAFISMFNKVLEVMAGIDGHGESHLYRDVNDGCSFLIVSEWTRRQAFDDFIASETFAKVATWGREQILAARPKHQVFGHDEPA
jgi:heme-degrading monooxygenase HmoA